MFILEIHHKKYFTGWVTESSMVRNLKTTKNSENIQGKHHQKSSLGLKFVPSESRLFFVSTDDLCLYTNFYSCPRIAIKFRYMCEISFSLKETPVDLQY